MTVVNTERVLMLKDELCHFRQIGFEEVVMLHQPLHSQLIDQTLENNHFRALRRLKQQTVSSDVCDPRVVKPQSEFVKENISVDNWRLALFEAEEQMIDERRRVVVKVVRRCDRNELFQEQQFAFVFELRDPLHIDGDSEAHQIRIAREDVEAQSNALREAVGDSVIRGCAERAVIRGQFAVHRKEAVQSVVEWTRRFALRVGRVGNGLSVK